MKVFISWSGKESQRYAQVLRKWIPVIIQGVEIFVSSEDISKGHNWNQVITNELEQSDFGIVCLTKDNRREPWINFEAGAIAKKLNSRVSALMIGIEASDIDGPLKSFQATRLDKDDFIKLIKEINIAAGSILDDKTIEMSFNMAWKELTIEFEKMKKQFKKDNNESKNSTAIEELPKSKEDYLPILNEILQTVRDQERMLSNNEKLLVDQHTFLCELPHNGVINKTKSISKENVILMLNIIKSLSSYLLWIVKKIRDDNALQDYNFDISQICIDIRKLSREESFSLLEYSFPLSAISSQLDEIFIILN